MPTRIPQQCSVIETAGAALFIGEVARDLGDTRLASWAGDAALHMRGIQGLSDGHREDKVRILAGPERDAAVHILDAMIEHGDVMAEAAKAVRVELTDPDQFWREIAEAKALSRMAGVPDIPDTPGGLVEGLYGTGPMSRVDLTSIDAQD